MFLCVSTSRWRSDYIFILWALLYNHVLNHISHPLVLQQTTSPDVSINSAASNSHLNHEQLIASPFASVTIYPTLRRRPLSLPDTIMNRPKMDYLRGHDSMEYTEGLPLPPWIDCNNFLKLWPEILSSRTLIKYPLQTQHYTPVAQSFVATLQGNDQVTLVFSMEVTISYCSALKAHHTNHHFGLWFYTWRGLITSLSTMIRI